jgi:hypothetical protein
VALNVMGAQVGDDVLAGPCLPRRLAPLLRHRFYLPIGQFGSSCAVISIGGITSNSAIHRAIDSGLPVFPFRFDGIHGTFLFPLAL